jgi:hypothetical protein
MGRWLLISYLVHQLFSSWLMGCVSKLAMHGEPATDELAPAFEDEIFE